MIHIMRTVILVFIGLCVMYALISPTHSEGSINSLENNRDRKRTNTISNPLHPPYCGYNNATVRRIVGGHDAKLGEQPWMTLLGYEGINGPQWLCGGCLISDRHVLTAAHCISDILYLVRIGDLDIDNDNDGANPFQDRIQEKIIHPSYNSQTIENDVAVLKTIHRVPFTSILHPICLPVDYTIKNKKLDRTYAFIAGWGTIKFMGNSSSKLLQAEVPISTKQECKSAYKTFDSIIDDRVVCAGFTEGGVDTCQGDSGGPLIYVISKVSYVVGIVSYGYKCAEPGYPGVYTRVTSFLNFILSIIEYLLEAVLEKNP